jgi:hypothetical protein
MEILGYDDELTAVRMQIHQLELSSRNNHARFVAALVR